MQLTREKRMPRTLLPLCLAAFFASPFVGQVIGVGPAGAKSLYSDPTRGITWIVSIILFLGVGLSVGFLMKNKLLGLAIDWRNRYSLSRFQVLLWTLLAIPTIYCGLMFNVLRGWGVDRTASGLSIEWTLVALMGISVGSFLAAPMALSVKENTELTPKQLDAAVSRVSQQEGAPHGTILAAGQVLTRNSPERALLSDLFRGEETGNAGIIDIARMQMLALTLVVWLVYLVQAGAEFFHSQDAIGILEKLPTFNESLLVLVLVSHGGYITGKVVPGGGSPRERTGRDLARINKVEMRALALTSQIDEHVRVKAIREDMQAIPLRLAEQVRQVVVDARALNDKVAEGVSVGEDLAILEGRLDALESSFRLNQAHPVECSSDTPSEDLVMAIKKGLQDRGFIESSALIPKWGKLDEAALDKFLAEQGVPKEAVSANLVDRLEAVEALLG